MPWRDACGEERPNHLLPPGNDGLESHRLRPAPWHLHESAGKPAERRGHSAAADTQSVPRQRLQGAGEKELDNRLQHRSASPVVRYARRAGAEQRPPPGRPDSGRVRHARQPRHQGGLHDRMPVADLWPDNQGLAIFGRKLEPTPGRMTLPARTQFSSPASMWPALWHRPGRISLKFLRHA